VSETNELADGDLVTEEPQVEEKQNGGKAKWLAVGASGVAVLAIAAAVGVGVYGQNQVDAARKGEHKAQAEAKSLKNQPPKVVTKTVTKNVPTFGKSVLMGIYASGSIQSGGVYDSAGNQNFTPNDSTCSDQYSTLSGQYTSMAIDRGEFMQACQNSLTQTLKKNTTP
jgi:hypothetical protein